MATLIATPLQPVPVQLTGIWTFDGNPASSEPTVPMVIVAEFAAAPQVTVMLPLGSVVTEV
jgi:hypothetical protein